MKTRDVPPELKGPGAITMSWSLALRDRNGSDERSRHYDRERGHRAPGSHDRTPISKMPPENQSLVTPTRR